MLKTTKKLIGTEIIDGKEYKKYEVIQTCSKCGSDKINVNVSRGKVSGVTCYDCEVSFDNSNKLLNNGKQTTGSELYNVSLEGRSDVIEPGNDKALSTEPQDLNEVELNLFINQLPISESNKELLIYISQGLTETQIGNIFEVSQQSINKRLKTIKRQLESIGYDLDTFRNLLY